jgi:hypothetical protein
MDAYGIGGLWNIRDPQPEDHRLQWEAMVIASDAHFFLVVDNMYKHSSSVFYLI